MEEIGRMEAGSLSKRSGLGDGDDSQQNGSNGEAVEKWAHI